MGLLEGIVVPTSGEGVVAEDAAAVCRTVGSHQLHLRHIAVPSAVLREVDGDLSPVTGYFCRERVTVLCNPLEAYS